MTTPTVSFEFFPPRDLAASFRLWDTVRALAPLNPTFVSVTYGAGGTTRQLTHEAVTTIGSHTGLPVAAHLTCVDASREETLAIVDAYKAAGITEIVALRGDPPAGATSFVPHPDGFASSVELVRAVADRGMTVRVGAYPEPHPDFRGGTSDLDWLRAKVDAGATSAITQFFFRAETFLRFRDRCADAGISAEILPGILPVQSWEGAKRFAARCGTSVPGHLDAAFATAKRDGREALYATAICAELCGGLLREGVGHLHFYTLNRPELTRDVCAMLGLAPQTPLAEVA